MIVMGAWSQIRQSIGIDGTTMEANAAMKSIVRRDDGRSYEEFLVDLAKASGIDFAIAKATETATA